LYPDGARELASLVVLASHRGLGVAGAMVDELLADGAGPTYLLIDRPYLAHFGRWGFRPVAPATLPASVRRTYRVGRAVTTVLSIAARRRIRIVAAARP
jgi:hypothetical protein